MSISNNINRIIVTDCGSTTTKAILFEKKENVWVQSFEANAPTTVEKPYSDVKIGVINSIKELEKVSGLKLIQKSKESPIIKPSKSKKGTDLYLTTSSAGGGLQMAVSGLVSSISSESAKRAALGAGAIVLKNYSLDDGIKDFDKILDIRELKPDIFLIAGGCDDNKTEQIFEIAELIISANPKPRFGSSVKLPIIYAGNKNHRQDIINLLKDYSDIEVVENLRPSLDTENLKPARDKIHDFFLTHVMSHSPGYNELLNWVDYEVMATPNAFGNQIDNYAKETNQSVLAVDIGGATTDVFSVFKNKEGKPIFNRSVSANLGMSYSASNVLIEAGVDNIKRWLTFDMDSSDIENRIRNKMLRPTTIPMDIKDLKLEQALAREALSLSFEHHISLAVGLSGGAQKRTIADIFNQSKNSYELVDLKKLDMIIGSGGVISHAPSRLDACLMLLDSFLPVGVTKLCIDSEFMIPHLGVLSSVDSNIANEVFKNSCLLNIAISVVPKFKKKYKSNEFIFEFKFGKTTHKILYNRVNIIKIESENNIFIEKNKNIDFKLGFNLDLNVKIDNSFEYLIIDTRNRPVEDFDNWKIDYNNLEDFKC